MAIICQNCGSSDVVSIQGQEFCINCGSIVIVPTNSVTEPSKAVPEPVPEPDVSSAIPVVVKSEVVTPIEPNHQPNYIKEPPPTSKAVADDAPKYHQRSHSHHEQHRPTILHQAKAHPLSYGLRVAATVGLPVSLAISAGLWFNLDRDIMVYLLLGSLLFVGVMLVLAQSALLYGLSRAQDGRPVGRKQWWAVARGGFIEILNADLLTLITQVIAVASAFSLWQTFLRVHNGTNNIDIAMLVLGNVLLAWMLLGTLAARRIAIPAIIIGNLSGVAAVKLGWRCYMRAGGHLIMALAETWIARLALILALLTLILTAGHYAPVLNEPMVVLAAGVALFVSLFALFILMLQIETKVWLKQYRQWVNTFLAAQRIKLLSGRNKKTA